MTTYPPAVNPHFHKWTSPYGIGFMNDKVIVQRCIKCGLIKVIK